MADILHFQHHKPDMYLCLNNQSPPQYLTKDSVGNFFWGSSRIGAALFSRSEANKVHSMLVKQGAKVRFEPVT